MHTFIYYTLFSECNIIYGVQQVHIYICKLDDYEEEDAWAEEGECSGFSFFLRGKSLSFFGRGRHGDVDHGGPLHGAPHVIFHNNNTETIALYVARRCD